MTGYCADVETYLEVKTALSLTTYQKFSRASPPFSLATVDGNEVTASGRHGDLNGGGGAGSAK